MPEFPSQRFADQQAGHPDDMRHDEISIGGSEVPCWLQQGTEAGLRNLKQHHCRESS